MIPYQISRDDERYKHPSTNFNPKNQNPLLTQTDNRPENIYFECRKVDDIIPPSLKRIFRTSPDAFDCLIIVEEQR